MSKKIIFIFFFILTSCGGVDFVYKNDVNLNNPIYDKSSLKYSGKDVPAIKRVGPLYFGKNITNEFLLPINIEEDKSKRSVQSNQAVSKLDYSLIFSYVLLNNKEGCVVYKKNIISRFSHEPKSSGYNFGSDQSLEQLYEIAVKNNIQNFIGFVSSENITNCLNEN